MRYILYVKLGFAAIRLLKTLANENKTKEEQKAAVIEVLGLTIKGGNKTVEQVLDAFDDSDYDTFIGIVKFIIGLKKSR